MKSTNYYNTFIEVAEDCPLESAEVPPQKGDEKTVANLQFNMMYSHPYQYTSDDVIFGVYAIKKDICAQEIDQEREKFFSKGNPCFRASPLTKRYGWGIHSNAEGKIAVFAIESEEYQKLSADQTLRQLKAMHSRRS